MALTGIDIRTLNPLSSSPPPPNYYLAAQHPSNTDPPVKITIAEILSMAAAAVPVYTAATGSGIAVVGTELTLDQPITTSSNLILASVTADKFICKTDAAIDFKDSTDTTSYFKIDLTNSRIETNGVWMKGNTDTIEFQDHITTGAGSPKFKLTGVDSTVPAGANRTIFITIGTDVYEVAATIVP
jgi:hypothetical protein